jgi:hypothetical protein
VIAIVVDVTGSGNASATDPAIFELVHYSGTDLSFQACLIRFMTLLQRISPRGFNCFACYSNIVQYVDFEYLPRKSNWTASIYMEYCGEGDLSGDVA